MELEQRKQQVRAWAERNWEKLEPQVLAEEKALKEAYQHSFGIGWGHGYNFSVSPSGGQGLTQDLRNDFFSELVGKVNFP